MDESSRSDRFRATVLVHIDAGFNLASWLLRDPIAAEDAVQESCVRALRALDQVTGASARSWFLAIVRNQCLDLIKDRRAWSAHEPYDEEKHCAILDAQQHQESPETAMIRSSEAAHLRECLHSLAVPLREVLILREFEELSYKEIAAIVGVPIGTVMSRLSRGRDLLLRRLEQERLIQRR